MLSCNVINKNADVRFNWKFFKITHTHTQTFNKKTFKSPLVKFTHIYTFLQTYIHIQNISIYTINVIITHIHLKYLTIQCLDRMVVNIKFFFQTKEVSFFGVLFFGVIRFVWMRMCVWKIVQVVVVWANKVQEFVCALVCCLKWNKLNIITKMHFVFKIKYIDCKDILQQELLSFGSSVKVIKTEKGNW